MAALESILALNVISEKVAQRRDADAAKLGTGAFQEEMVRTAQAIISTARVADNWSRLGAGGGVARRRSVMQSARAAWQDDGR